MIPILQYCCTYDTYLPLIVYIVSQSIHSLYYCIATYFGIIVNLSVVIIAELHMVTCKWTESLGMSTTQRCFNVKVHTGCISSCKVEDSQKLYILGLEQHTVSIFDQLHLRQFNFWDNSYPSLSCILYDIFYIFLCIKLTRLKVSSELGKPEMIHKYSG